MVLEIATIDIMAGQQDAFEAALGQAQSLLAQSPGYIGHTFHHGIENPHRYVLLIEWETLEAHTVGFRESELFTQWRALIGPFFAQAPEVLHYTRV
ncbi:MAG: antibiotic biosynthesis monooxygenase family protein [Saprospiraceae bacterium]